MTNYDSIFSPAAPVLSIVLEHPYDASRTTRHRMLIDTGSDVTCIPMSVISSLSLGKEYETSVAGYDGNLERRDVFHVTLRIENYVIKTVRVISIPGEIGVLGRDVLSAFTLTLRGKEQTFDLVDP